jgi:hypothetical protein
MNNISFKLKKNWEIKSDLLENGSQIIFYGGHIFEPDENSLYVISSPVGTRTLSLEQMREHDKFMEVKQHNMNITNTDDEVTNDEVVNNWRIQLDVKTTKSKLKEVQVLIEKHIYPIL